MSGLPIGVDFGTSNSAVAVVDPGGTVRVAPWVVPDSLRDTTSSDASGTVPTAIFAPSYQKVFHFGWDAIATYLDEGFAGRFMKSIKAFLPQASFTGTVIGGRKYALEDLVAMFLTHLVGTSRESLALHATGPIVLGRPARFSLDLAEDTLAEERLRRAATLAGLGDVELVIEPVAAALAYEATLTRDETVLVVDLGGGTSDFTLLEVGPSHRTTRDRARSILAVRGVPRAGDFVDGEVVEARLFDPLGYGCSYVSFTKPTPVPHWIWHRLKRWNLVSFLKEERTLELLRTVERSTDRPAEIRALLDLVESDLGFLLFRAVERAKRNVHREGTTAIADPEGALPVSAQLTGPQFAALVAPFVDEIATTARQTLADASVAPARVDAVFMTGGTSLVPEVRTALGDLFGADRLRSQSTFTSVVEGLARAAASLSSASGTRGSGTS